MGTSAYPVSRISFPSFNVTIYAMTNQTWPDALSRPEPDRVQFLLVEFWQRLRALPDLLIREEHLLAERNTAGLRDLIIEMMLALNGIQWPPTTVHLNRYLGASQRAAIEKTLVAPTVNDDSWIGRAVALVVIYRWYAPQLVEKYGLEYPQALEDETWAQLQREVPAWPLTVTTA